MQRRQIFARDDFQCVYCGERFEPEALTVDHVRPRMRGGDRSGGNLVTACGACNARKAGTRLADFLRADAEALRNFRMRASAHVWPRIIREVEEELAHPPKRRRY